MVAAWGEHGTLHPAERSARVLAAVLAGLDLDLDTNPVILGATGGRPRHIVTLPEFGWGPDAQARIELPGLVALMEAEPVPSAIAAFMDGHGFGGHHSHGHLAIDLERVVHLGLEEVIAACDSHADDRDPDAQATRRGMAIACRAVIAWAQRHAAAADAAADGREDAEASELRLAAAACRRVPARPARNLREALQAIALCHLAIHLEGHGLSVSLGLLDRVLAPFAEESVRGGYLLEAFLLAIHANGIGGRFAKTQAITLGGSDPAGRDRCTAATLAILRACDALRVPDPHVFLRWHPGLDPAVMAQACSMLRRGVSMPLLVNDAPTVAGLVRAGIATADAWDYCVIGCNELGIPGRACEMAMGPGLVHLEPVHAILMGERPPADLDEWLARYEETVESLLREQMPCHRAQRDRLATERPTPFTSALMRDAVERGVDCANGLRYRIPASYERGLGNAVDALAAVDGLVFRGTLPMAGLRAALSRDWPDETLRRRFLACAAWGNDDPRVDAIARALLDARNRALARVAAALGLPGILPCHVVRSLHHLAGQALGATADGRHAGDPVGDSLGAVPGRALAGPTAVLGSVASLDLARDYGGGTNLNLTLNPTGMTDAHVRALIEGFFAAGGQELQLACIDAATLRAALRDPEGHRDLLVRIAGFNARFVELGPLEQRELIARTERA